VHLGWKHTSELEYLVQYYETSFSWVYASTEAGMHVMCPPFVEFDGALRAACGSLRLFMFHGLVSFWCMRYMVLRSFVRRRNELRKDSSSEV
jgi:hypothetical protein